MLITLCFSFVILCLSFSDITAFPLGFFHRHLANLPVNLGPPKLDKQKHSILVTLIWTKSSRIYPRVRCQFSFVDINMTKNSTEASGPRATD